MDHHKNGGNTSIITLLGNRLSYRASEHANRLPPRELNDRH